MSLRNSKLILAKGIKLNKKYTEVLSYKESEMVALLRNNVVREMSDFSYLSPNETYIDVDLPYSVVAQSNYIGFENPYFNNKWYFAFLDKPEYISDKVTRIHFIIDYFSTWFDYWSAKDCFIIRQHATTDTIGSNLVDENVELGEYIHNGAITEYFSIYSDLYYFVQVGFPSTGSFNVGGSVIADNIFIDVVLEAQTKSELDTILTLINGFTNMEILNAWSSPKRFAPPRGNTSVPAIMTPLQPYVVDETYRPNTAQNTAFSYTAPTTLNGYTPNNNKLLTSPYCFLTINNRNGITNNLAYEFFEARTPKLKMIGIATPGAPCIFYPYKYKNMDENINEGINCQNTPLLAWKTDGYDTWLKNKSLQTKSQSLTSGELALGGAGLLFSSLMFGPGVAIGSLVTGGINALSNSFEYMSQKKVAKALPDSFYGNLTSSDLFQAMGYTSPSLEPMSITSANARRIDEFFTRYGYATNEIATPNITHRSNYNYIRVSNDSSPCIINNHNNIAIPQNDLEVINNLFRNGITIWHNHANLGNYAVTNTIVL